MTLTALRDSEGTLVGFSKVTRDFSARRAVETALAQKARAATAQVEALVVEASRQQMLVATVSHELRTPLTAMLGHVALLAKQVDHPEQRASIERLERSSQHLLHIVNDLLDNSRAEARSFALTPSMQRLGPALHDAISDVESEARRKGVAIINAASGAAEDLPYVGDERRVRQILVNLLTNAIKFTEAGGRVTLSGGAGITALGALVAGAGPWVYVRVEDTGRGIPADRLESVFEPFQQSEASDQGRGVGVGLSISRQFARGMGGDITLHSVVGAGSTFTLWLRMAESYPVPR